MSRRLFRTQRQRGAVIPLAALLMTVLILMVAFAVDLGRQRAERRDMQAIADVVSLDLARQLEGRDAKEIDNDPAFGDAIEDSTARNDHPITVTGNTQHTKTDQPCDADITGPCLNVTLGTWDDAAYSFTPCAPRGDPDRELCIPEAVQVEAGNEIDYGFQPGSGDARRTAVARVGDAARARFQVGSTLAAINPQTSSMIGQILSSVITDASLLGYEGLADANVTLEDYEVPLNAPLTTASPDELADTTVTYEELVVASAEALESGGGDAADVALLDDLASRQIEEREVNVVDVFGFEAGSGPAGAGVTVNVAQVLTTAAFLATGDHFVEITDPNLLDVPGIAGIGINLSGIEAPRQGGNHDGAQATTSQVSMVVEPIFDIDTAEYDFQVCDVEDPDEQDLLNSLIGGILSLAECTLGLVDPLPLSIEVTGSAPLQVDIAEIEVTQSIDCANDDLILDPTSSVVDISSDLDLRIQATLDGNQLHEEGDATAIDLARLFIGADAHSSGDPAPVTFAGENGMPLPTGTRYEDFDPDQARVGASPLGLSNFLEAKSTTLEVLSEDLSWTTTNRILPLVQPYINDTLHTLDTRVLQRLATLLGIHMGGADLKPLWMECDESAVLLVE